MIKKATEVSNNHILIVDDETSIRTLLSEILDDEGYRTSEAPHSEAALHIMSKDRPNLIILDIWLDNSDMDGMEILAHVKQHHPEIPVLMISGHGNIEMAVNAMKLGAYEFIEKPFNSDRLLLTIERALETNKLRAENIGLKKQTNTQYESFTATDPASIQLKNLIEKSAPTQSRILVTGPSGSGKKLVCYMLHKKSNFSKGDINFLECRSFAADPYDQQKRCIETFFSEGAGKTLVLQDVHELSMPAQSYLITILQNKSLMDHARLITTADFAVLEQLVRDGKFKEDLFYRLNIVHIELPALKDRKQDISELSNRFLKSIYDKKGETAPTLSSEANMLLMNYDWPGNIRQLKNIIEHVAMMAKNENASIITLAHIPSDIKKSISASAKDQNAEHHIDGDDMNEAQLLEWLSLPMKEARQQFEKYYLDFQMRHFSGQISKVAEHIGMERTALHRKLKSLEEVMSAAQGMDHNLTDAVAIEKKKAKG